MLKELLILCGCSCLTLAKAPAFIWDPQSSDSPEVLEHLSNVKFTEVIQSRIHGKKKIVVFLMDKLSVEDLHMHAESFAHVKSEMSRGWSLSVGSVDGVVPHLNQLHNSQIIKLSRDDLDKSDEMIAEVMKREENKDSLGVFTAEQPSVQVDSYVHYSGRHLLAAEDEKPSSSFYNVSVNDTNIFLLFNQINFVVRKEENKTLEKPTLVKLTNDSLVVAALPSGYGFTMTWTKPNSVKLSVEFSQSRMYRRWLVNRMWLDASWNTSSVKNSTLDVSWLSAPLSRSYHCSVVSTASTNVTSGDKDAAELQFIEIQLEPYTKRARWSAADDCVGFYSIGVWMGLAPVILFTLLLVWGLSMISDIKINDRFDDPRGKTIQVNASE